MSKELLKAIYEMNETHYEPLRTTERDKVIKLVEQELSKLNEIKEVVNKEPSNSLAKIIAYEYIEKILKEKGW